MRHRLATAALLLAAVALNPVPSSAAPPPAEGGTLVVPANGMTVSTVFSTATDHVYEITVSGQYTYDGGPHNADCAYWQPPELFGGWVEAAFFQVDGGTAGCNGMPFDSLHTYTWTQHGTGAPLSFTVVDYGGSADNAGGFAVQVSLVGNDDPEVTGDCQVLSVDDSENDVTAFLVALHAEAVDPPSYGVAIAAECVFSGPSGEVARVGPDGGVPGPVVAWTDVVLLPRAAYTLCLHVQVLWRDGLTEIETCKPA